MLAVVALSSSLCRDGFSNHQPDTPQKNNRIICCCVLFLFLLYPFLGSQSSKLDVQDDAYRQVVPQLALLHLQRRLRQVELGDGEPRDGVVQVEPKGHQPDVDVCNAGNRVRGRSF